MGPPAAESESADDGERGKAPRLSAVAGIAARDAMAATAGDARQNWKRVLDTKSWRDAFLDKCAEKLSVEGIHLLHLVRVIDFHTERVRRSRSKKSGKPNRTVLRKAAESIARVVQDKAGTAATVRRVPRRTAEERTPGAWASQPATQPAKPRHPSNAAWEALRPLIQLDRLALPDHAVVAPVRVRQRYETWRKQRGLPEGTVADEKVARAMVHCEKPPAALASHADHLVFANSGERLRPSHYAELFEMPQSDVRRHFETGGNLHETKMVEALCRGVYAPDGMHAVRQAIAQYGRPLRPEGGPVQYAASFVGAGVQEAANDEIFGEWTFVWASEAEAPLREFLLETYGGRGLSEDRIREDACVAEETCPETDVFFMGPPCGPWSKRNRKRSHASAQDGESVLRRSMWYVEMARPKVIVVENVRSREGESIIEGVLASLSGYTMSTLEAKADSMNRERKFWLLSRDDE